MATNQMQKEFDVHDPNAVLQKFAQIRQALRQMDDDLTGLLYGAVTQLQKEQKEEQAKIAAVEAAKKKAEEQAKKPNETKAK
jgi:hypothetical protein